MLNFLCAAIVVALHRIVKAYTWLPHVTYLLILHPFLSTAAELTVSDCKAAHG